MRSVDCGSFRDTTSLYTGARPTLYDNTKVRKEEDTNVFGIPFRTDNNDYARGVTHLIIT
jgi:hypothetical protein